MRIPTSRPIAALRFDIDSWRWADVPFFVRTGKRLPVTATEVMATLRHPPQRMFDESLPTRTNYLRFRLGPDRIAIALGARIKSAGEAMVGHEIELFACNSSADEMTPYERLLGDALRGDARCLRARTPSRWHGASSIGCSRAAARRTPTSPARGGPDAAARMVERYGGWYDPPARARRIATDRRRRCAGAAARRAGRRDRGACEGCGAARSAVIALCGGETPWSMLEMLRELDVPWDDCTSRRSTNASHRPATQQRNLTRLLGAAGARRAAAGGTLLAMPVTDRGSRPPRSSIRRRSSVWPGSQRTGPRAPRARCGRPYRLARTRAIPRLKWPSATSLSARLCRSPPHDPDAARPSPRTPAAVAGHRVPRRSDALRRTARRPRIAAPGPAAAWALDHRCATRRLARLDRVTAKRLPHAREQAIRIVGAVPGS